MSGAEDVPREWLDGSPFDADFIRRSFPGDRDDAAANSAPPISITRS
jgi:hypothetical protein